MKLQFEEWYARHVHVQCLREWQYGEYKRVLRNAFKKGYETGRLREQERKVAESR